jgi:5-methylcytosine-specific restriction endonuclease McrA
MTIYGIREKIGLKGGKPLKKRKVKVWTPHRYLVAAARKTWRWSPDRRAVLLRAKQSQTLWKCETCGNLVSQIDYLTKRGRKRKKIDGAIDHIVPIGKQPKKWSDYKKWYEKLFCSIENLQFLCTECHLIKSLKERTK